MNTVKTTISIQKAWHMALGWALLLCAGPLLAQGVYLCPGHLITNEIDPAQARARGCVAARAGGLSQVQPDPALLDEGSEHTAPLARADNTATPTAMTPPPLAATPPRDSASGREGGGREQQARAILEAELVRTRQQLQALPADSTEGEQGARLRRLRADEAALQRELARRPG